MSRISFVQYRCNDTAGARAVAALIDDQPPRRLVGIQAVYELANMAAAKRQSLSDIARSFPLLETVDLEIAEQEGRLLAPIDHPDPAHLYVTGTGLTHLGSAAGRDAMHRKPEADQPVTDSMRMFLMGVEGGKPAPGEIGVQPEWFYKGNGECVVGSGGALVSPKFAEDAGEEPEIAGIYLIGQDGTPLRLGFCLANEFSDHRMERGNYLWLAHSKLRPTALGPELLTGSLPLSVEGTVRILRNGSTIWEKGFLSGESNMSHSIANLEYHHFKYDQFRKPGDIHVHVFGTATLSFSDGVSTADGDVFEIEAEPFRLPLRNALRQAQGTTTSVLSL